ncbi:MAG: acetyl-CoA carboxylase biotin carboxyl carrier protein subunit [Gammaproteobacteria bacterium]
MASAFVLDLDGERHALGIAARRPALELTLDGAVHTVSEGHPLADGSVQLTVDGRHYTVWRTHEGDRVHLQINGRTFSVAYEDAIAAAQHGAGGEDVLRADMPGVVVAVHCAPGARVGAGDTLMVVESMKMQINVVAPRDGVVERVDVDVNDAFNKGDVLAALEAED